MLCRLKKILSSRYRLITGGNVPGSRENTHELFVGFEGLPQFEADVHLVQLLEVSSKRREMIGIEPLPRRRLYPRKSAVFSRSIMLTYSLVIIMQNPSHTFDVVFRDAGNFVRAGSCSFCNEHTFFGTQYHSAQRQTSDGSSALGSRVPITCNLVREQCRY